MESTPEVAGPSGAVATASGPAWSRPVVALPVLGLVSLVAGLFPSFSVAANVLVFAAGAVLCWLGFSDSRPRPAAPRALRSGARWWLLPAAALIAVEAVNYLLGSSYDNPTLSKLADPALDRYEVRAVAFFGWLWAFWALVRR